jgi:sulfate adenylyltransferase subunit 1
VQPVAQLQLKSGTWTSAETLYMNAIGKVHLSFDEAAIFDPYEQNRSSGSFILIDPDTNNTVAGGMITGKRSELGGIHGGDARVILSLPADLADQIMASELFANRRHEAEVRRMTAAQAADLWSDAASDI